MEHEEIYTLMMEALDGELQDSGHEEMAAHLHSCPSCNREWQALQAIHQLFLQTSAMSPAADFTQRTLARLPSSPYRIWMISAVYGLLLIVGFLPLAIIAWLTITIGPALNQPAIIRSLLNAGGQILGLGQTVLEACWRGLGGLAEIIGQQPAIIGWLLVMVGVVLLWGGVYGQLTGQRSRV